MARTKRRGFTLIEVTLAIVIGVIMIAGATLLYNQSKISSGNSRAQAKVLALQQLIEEYAANNQGTYPGIDSVRSLFKRKRPDDYLKSPWGGQIGTDLQQAGDAQARGIADHSKTKSTVAPGDNDPWTQEALEGMNTVATGKPLNKTSYNGGLAFSLNNASTGTEGQDNTATRSIFDVITNVTKTVRGYSLWIYDQQGQYPNFAAGGKPE
ncbi:MAG: type II secretion system protein [Candidatus Sericytochromatia bacterium]|nr:type II secretion system protein [Candidatus Tanganyikabacteria bacterium]